MKVGQALKGVIKIKLNCETLEVAKRRIIGFDENLLNFILSHETSGVLLFVQIVILY